MNTLLESLPPKEKDLFRQLVTLYDEKKFKKSLKLLHKLMEINPSSVGPLTRVRLHEGPVGVQPARRVPLRPRTRGGQGGGLTRRWSRS